MKSGEGDSGGAFIPQIGELNKAEFTAGKVLFLGSISSSYAGTPAITAPQKKPVIVTNIWANPSTTGLKIIFKMTIAGASTEFFSFDCDTGSTWGAIPVPSGATLEVKTSSGTAGLMLAGTEISQT